MLREKFGMKNITTPPIDRQARNICLENRKKSVTLID